MIAIIPKQQFCIVTKLKQPLKPLKWCTWRLLLLHDRNNELTQITIQDQKDYRSLLDSIQSIEGQQTNNKGRLSKVSHVRSHVGPVLLTQTTQGWQKQVHEMVEQIATKEWTQKWRAETVGHSVFNPKDATKSVQSYWLPCCDLQEREKSIVTNSCLKIFRQFWNTH